MPLLSVRDVKKTYRARSGAASRLALDAVSFDLEASEFVAVMGPSGSGKTTLLNLIGLVDKPDSGDVAYDGVDARSLREPELSVFRRRAIGFVLQDASLIDTMTVEENIALPLAFDRADPDRMEARVAELASALGIADILGKYPCEISGGQRQRAASARALACGPRLLLADEPTGALDSKSGRDLMERFAALNEERGSAVLMVTHDPFAASWASRAIFLRDGRAFTEIRRAGDRRAFFDRIMEVLAAMEGGAR